MTVIIEKAFALSTYLEFGDILKVLKVFLDAPWFVLVVCGRHSLSTLLVNDLSAKSNSLPNTLLSFCNYNRLWLLMLSL